MEVNNFHEASINNDVTTASFKKSSETIVIANGKKTKTEADENSPLILDATQGLRWQIAVLFIIGEVSGGSVVSIGYGFVNAGWYGIPTFIIAYMSNLYMGILHSKSMIQISDKKQKVFRSRTPYNEIIEHALGKKARRFSAMMLNTFTLCTSTIFLLISSELIMLLLGEFFTIFQNKNGFRILLAIFAILLIPITWLGTPKEYWGIALAATLSTVFAAVFLVTCISLEKTKDVSDIPEKEVTFLTYFNALGIIIFAFSGVPMFPNIQNDMRDQNKFPKSIAYGYTCMALIYLPVGLTAMILLGSETQQNLIYNVFEKKEYRNENFPLANKVMGNAILILLAVHLLFAYNLVFNTTAQECEEMWHIPRGFCWQRCLIRTGLVLFTLILAEAIPDFSIIISMVGGIIQSILSYILPAIAYYRLNTNLSLTTKTGMLFCVFIGLVGILGTTYSGVRNIIQIYS